MNNIIGYMAVFKLPGKKTVSVTAEYSERMIKTVVADIMRDNPNAELLKVDTVDNIKKLLRLE